MWIVLLTVTTTHRPATDLGYLLVKHPDRVHAFEVPTGTAYVVDSVSSTPGVCQAPPAASPRARARPADDGCTTYRLPPPPFAS